MAPVTNAYLVPMPAFTDPNLPEAAGGSINFNQGTWPSIEEHPVKHSPDFGANVGFYDFGGEEPELHEAPADRADWKKADWVDKAREYGLAVSGNFDAVKGRVEEYEAALKAEQDADNDNDNN
jgi:hypothetical protein